MIFHGNTILDQGVLHLVIERAESLTQRCFGHFFRYHREELLHTDQEASKTKRSEGKQTGYLFNGKHLKHK